MTILAQQYVSPEFRHFDLADGFAITLIAMLFLVLGGFLLIARSFRRRERDEDQAVDHLLSEVFPERDPQAAPSKRVKKGRAGESHASWEREADWWRRDG